MDIILAFMLGSVLSHGIVGAMSLAETVVAAATLIGLHWAFAAASFRSKVWGKMVKGKARPLVNEGQIQWSNMAESQISEEDLMEALRLNGNTDDLESVSLAVKERG